MAQTSPVFFTHGVCMEFRTMRRSTQMLAPDECLRILESGKTGVLACLSEDGYPYAVPLNYVYHDNAIWIHCAKEGHKLDAIKAHENVSFCVIEADDVVQKEYTTYYRSVICFGKASLVEGEAWLEAFEALADKYGPSRDEDERQRMVHMCSRSQGLVIRIEHVSGKEAKELVRQRT